MDEGMPKAGGPSVSPEAPVTTDTDAAVSRRSLLKAGALAASVGAAATLIGTGAVRAQPAPGASPWENRRFRGFVKDGGTLSVADLELIWPINPREVIIATEATQVSYTNAWESINPDYPFDPSSLTPAAGDRARPPIVMGYIGVGRVAYVGEQVRRVQVGDRVIVGVTPQCGQCYNCLNGRADMCLYLNGDEINGNANRPHARLVGDGRTVSGPRAGFQELMVAWEDYVAPVYTDLPATALSLLGSVGATGIAVPTSFTPVVPGTDVVVFGCGPIGLSMVNGAAIMGANRIVAVEPIAHRREAALALGATAAVDPTGKDDTLVAELKAMTQGRTKRFYSGGRGGMQSEGPDYIFEATGSQMFDPALRGIEPQPDPIGMRELGQIIDLCPSYGTMVTTGVRWSGGQLTLGAFQMGPTGKRWITGQNGGAHLMRDAPRWVSMMERGQYQWQRIVSSEYPLEQSQTALDEAAYRTKISSHIVFDPTPFLE